MTLKKNEVWQKKSIIWDFAISNLKIKYRSSVLGFVWSFLEPLLLLSVLYLVFTNVFESTIEHFPLYLLLGLITWNMFVNGTKLSIDSVVARGPLLQQIRIPNEIPAISSAITSLLMISLEMIVFGIFLIAFEFVPPYTIIILPLVVFLNFFLVLGISLPLSLLNVKFRDTQFIWSVILQAGFFLNPIFYKIEILPQEIQSILAFSPMVHILNISRDVALYGILPTVENVVLVIGMTFLIFGIGFIIFKKLSPKIIEEL
jgi:lipopolysaccharide transport system permease protein